MELQIVKLFSRVTCDICKPFIFQIEWKKASLDPHPQKKKSISLKLVMILLDAALYYILNSLVMSQGDGKFKEVTRLFYEGQYELGLQQVNRLLDGDPRNSMLYSNRALFESQLEKDEEATHDLNTALLLNPLNYIAHFNIFSIHVRNNENIEAFQHLCSSLSVLYLIRARVNASLVDAERSIYFANNNIQAHLLSAFLELKNGQSTQAQQHLRNALRIDPENQIVLRVWKQLGLKEEADIPGKQNFTKQLVGSVKVDEENVEDQINEKVTQFNQIYTQVNNTIGAVTQKVPKSTISNNIETFMRQSRQKQNKDNSYAVVHDPGVATPSPSQLETPIPAATQNQLQVQFEGENFHSVIQQHFESIINPKQDKQQKRGQKFNLIYPLTEGDQLGITVLRMELQGINQQRFKDLYCIISYDEGRSKLKTVGRPLEGGLCNWNQQFPPFKATHEPSEMKVKVYNKNKTSVRDELIGELEVLITTADLLRLPLYDKKGLLKASLFVQLQLLERPRQSPEEILHD